MVAQEMVVSVMSESASGRRVVPGRSLPVGVDPSSEGSVLAWLKDHTGKIAECAEAYAGKIEGAGFTDLHSIGFEVSDLLDVGIPKGHAITIANNAGFISRVLGSVPASEVSELTREKRGAFPKFPAASSDPGARGMPAKEAMLVYGVRVASWCRGWSEELGDAIDTMLQVPGTDVLTLQAKVPATVDIAFASDLVGALSDASIKYVGEGMIRGGSGLALFQKLLVPYNGVTSDSKKKLLHSVTKPPTCNDLDSLHVGLAKWDSARESYTFTSGKTLGDDQLESILEGMYKATLISIGWEGRVS